MAKSPEEQIRARIAAQEARERSDRLRREREREERKAADKARADAEEARIKGLWIQKLKPWDQVARDLLLKLHVAEAVEGGARVLFPHGATTKTVQTGDSIRMARYQWQDVRVYPVGGPKPHWSTTETGYRLRGVAAIQNPRRSFDVLSWRDFTDDPAKRIKLGPPILLEAKPLPKPLKVELTTTTRPEVTLLSTQNEQDRIGILYVGFASMVPRTWAREEPDAWRSEGWKLVGVGTYITADGNHSFELDDALDQIAPHIVEAVRGISAPGAGREWARWEGARYEGNDVLRDRTRARHERDALMDGLAKLVRDMRSLPQKS